MVNISQSSTHLRLRKVKDEDQDTIFTRTIFHVVKNKFCIVSLILIKASLCYLDALEEGGDEEKAVVLQVMQQLHQQAGKVI